MKHSALILSLIVSLNCLGQDWTTSMVLNGSDIEPKYSAIDNNNNLIILAPFGGEVNAPINLTSYGAKDLLLLKLNSVGQVVWSKRIGSVSADIAGGLTIDGSNNIYVSGNYYANCRFSSSDSLINTGNADIFFAKYDQNGVLLWYKRVGSSSTLQSSFDIKYDGANRIVMAGFYKDSLVIGPEISNIDTLTGNSYTSNFIATFNLDGTYYWSKKFLGTNNFTRLRRIDISQNGYYFGGYLQGDLSLDIGVVSSYAPTTYDAFIYKTDFNGTGQWIRRIRGLSHENFKSLTTDEFDNVYILGNYGSLTIYVDSTETEVATFSGNTGGYDTFLGKYNRSGKLQWFVRKGSTAKDNYNDFVIRNNIIYTAGYFANKIIFNDDTLQTDNPLNEDAFVAAFNEIGDPISGVSVKGIGNFNDAGTIVNMDANSRAYVSGYFKSQQIEIGSQTYTSSNNNASDLFFAIYQQPFKAVITDENMVSCNGLSDGMLTVTPYFGRPPFTYSWSHNPGLNNPVAENLAAGDYTVTVTDANDSVAYITGHVTQSAALNIQRVITPVSCFNDNDGAIDITVTGGSAGAGYDYFWTTLDGSGIFPLNEDQTNLTSGTYTVQVMDDNLCSATADLIVTEPAPFNYNGTVVNNITIPPGGNGSVALTVTGGTLPYGFDWSGPGGFASASEDIASLSDAGLYSLTVTDDHNCISDTVFAVADNFTFIAQISQKTDVLCFGASTGSATVRVINGTPPFSYQWSDGPLLNDSVRTGMQPNNYIVTVTDGAAKTAQASVTINGPASALTLVLDHEDLRCNGDNSGVIDLTVTGGTFPYSFLWNIGYTGEDLVNVPAEIYTVTVTDGNGCQAQDTRTINEPEAIGLIINTTGEILCTGERTVNAIANASGGTPPGSYSYLWDDPGNQTTQTAFGLGAGLYHCTVTDLNNCWKTSEITVLEPEPLSVSALLENPSCPGMDDGSIIPTPSGGSGTGYEYIWSNGIYQRFNTDIPEGNYILTLNDDNHCVLVDTFALDDPDTVKITSLVSTDPSCFGLDNGTLAISVSGGSGIYEYCADGGANYVPTSVIASLSAGDYQVVVRDDKDCTTDIIPVSLIFADTVRIVDVEKTDLTCSGFSDGFITVTAAGGAGNYMYSNDGGASFISESVFTSLPQGDYEVVVKDDNDCLSEEFSISLVKEDICGLIIYNGFSPNNDGKNEVWNIGNVGSFPNIKVKIFNLWGKVVFSSDGYGTPWDGTFNGNDLPSGTYYYIIDPGDGSDILTGDVSLVK